MKQKPLRSNPSAGPLPDGAPLRSRPFVARVKRHLLNWRRFRQLLSIVIFFLAWICVVRIIPYFRQIPSPLEVLNALGSVKPSVMILEIARSYFRVTAGFALGLVIGFPIGLAIGYSRVLNCLLFPAVEIVRPIPPIAWIPLSVLFFKAVESQIVFLTFYGAFFPIAYNTIAGISQIDVRLPRAAISLGVNGIELLRRVILPAAMPQIFTGMKVAVGITWLLVVAAEMLASRGGLGYLIWYNHTVMNYPMVILGMGIIGLCGAMSSLAVDLAGQYFMRWRRAL
jgi:NitT/TauT family transport system permease protein